MLRWAKDTTECFLQPALTQSKNESSGTNPVFKFSAASDPLAFVHVTTPALPCALWRKAALSAATARGRSMSMGGREEDWGGG